MTEFTYDLATDVGKVRFEIPDTAAASPLFTDPEIDYALEQESGVLGAAARCCETLSRKYGQQADVATGDLKLTYSKQAESLADRAAELRIRAQGSHAPFAGGTSRTDKNARAEDEDRKQGSFNRGQFDNPGAAISEDFPFDGAPPRP